MISSAAASAASSHSTPSQFRGSGAWIWTIGVSFPDGPSQLSWSQRGPTKRGPHRPARRHEVSDVPAYRFPQFIFPLSDTAARTGGYPVPASHALQVSSVGIAVSVTFQCDCISYSMQFSRPLNNIRSMEKELTVTDRIVFALLVALAWLFVVFDEQEVPGAPFSNTEVRADSKRP
jgi:hypothetical protein